MRAVIAAGRAALSCAAAIPGAAWSSAAASPALHVHRMLIILKEEG